MADETVVAEPSLDEQLDTLFGTEKSKPAAPAAAAEAGKPTPGEAPASVASPKPEETDPLLAALEAIEEEKPEVKTEDGKPALSEDQKVVLDAIPNQETLKNIEFTLQSYNNFTTLLSTGKFDSVEAELSHWNPSVLDGWKDHIYEKHKLEFVDRFIAESEGKGKSKELTKLEREFAELKSSLEEKKTANANTEAQNRLQKSFDDYNKYVNELFDQIKFNQSDRRWVTADLSLRLAKEPKVLAAIKSGNAKAVVPMFKAAIREYVNRDKEVTQATDAKLKEQEHKKIPLGGGASETVGDVPEDIKAVKKGDEDKWLDRALGALFKKK